MSGEPHLFCRNYQSHFYTIPLSILRAICPITFEDEFVTKAFISVSRVLNSPFLEMSEQPVACWFKKLEWELKRYAEKDGIIPPAE